MPGTTLNITDLVTYQGQGYRVSYFKKRVEDNWPDLNPYDLVERERPNTPGDDVADEIITKIINEEREQTIAARKAKGLPHTRRFRYQHCTQAEATHVSLYGLTYPIAPIEEVTFEGPIGWSAQLIAMQQEEAASDFRMIHHPFSDWYWE